MLDQNWILFWGATSDIWPQRVSCNIWTEFGLTYTRKNIYEHCSIFEIDIFIWWYHSPTTHTWENKKKLQVLGTENLTFKIRTIRAESFRIYIQFPSIANGTDNVIIQYRCMAGSMYPCKKLCTYIGIQPRCPSSNACCQVACGPAFLRNGRGRSKPFIWLCAWRFSIGIYEVEWFSHITNGNLH